MRRRIHAPVFVIACVAALLPAAAAAQSHTLVALSHSDFTAYEIDPGHRAVLHKFTAQNQPHEGVASADGRTYYLAVPNGPHVVVLDATTFTQKAIVESPFFTSTKNKGSASPHGIAITDDGRKVYVGLENADVPGIVVIDTATNRVTQEDRRCAPGRTLPGHPAKNRQALLSDARGPPRAGASTRPPTRSRR